MRITKVSVAQLDGEKNSRGWINETLIANPMSSYPRYRERRSSWRYSREAVVLLETDSGHVGLGAPVLASAREIITDHLSTFLIGSDPFDTERLWDQMYKAMLPYGVKGLPIMALSSIDIALWDLKGKELGLPVWRLLGGKTRDFLPAYATGHDVRLAAEHGFNSFKIPMPYGPADGFEGMRRNVEAVAAARSAVGDEAELMVDCYMSWSVEYALHMARLLEPYRLRWIEEPLPPHDIGGYANLTAAVRSTSIATGEHEYTRWGQKELLARTACHVIQPDLAWVGGLTEALRVAALASAWGVPMVPHAGGLQPWALHFMIASAHTDLAEVLVVPSRDGGSLTSLYPYYKGVPKVVGGTIAAPEGPGLGVELDESFLA